MKFTITTIALLAALASGTAFAAEGNVSRSTLADMGLGDIAVMSDADGQTIRGHGFAYAASTAASALPGTYTANTAIALGFNHADASTGAQSQLEADILIGVPLPILSIQIKAKVGSAGYAIANSN
jgi:hypothetical protein